MTRADITLRGGKAERAEELKADVEESLGYEITWPRFMGELMRVYQAHKSDV